MKRVQLATSQSQLETLTEQLDKTRSTSKTAKVDAAALRQIMVDWTRLLAEVGPGNVQWTEEANDAAHKAQA